MKKMKSFIAGAITMLIAVLLINTVFAVPINKTITAVYNDIKIIVDGKQIEPKDVAGKSAEPFIFDGTTYLPVRAIAEAIGYDVEWDSSTNTVKLTKKANQTPTTTTTEKPTEPATETTTEKAVQATTEPPTETKTKSKGTTIIIETEKEHDVKYYKGFPDVPDFGIYSEAKLYAETNNAPYSAIFQYEEYTQGEIDYYIKLLIENGFYSSDTYPLNIFSLTSSELVYYKKNNITYTDYNKITGIPYDAKCNIVVSINTSTIKSAVSGNTLLIIGISIVS